MADRPKIAIAGAGSIGCIVGGILQHSGHDVSFFGRERVVRMVQEHGLHLTDWAGLDWRFAPDLISISTKPEILKDAEIVLVCVKSSASETIAKTIAKHCAPSTLVVSLQNGTQNVARLRKHLKGYDVRAGMVEYNVIELKDGNFHRGTSGKILIEAGDPSLANILNCEQLTIEDSDEIEPIQWGKLLVNLNNGLNALADMPLVEELSQRKWRVRFANQMSEALAVLNAEGIKPSPPSPVPANWLPAILKLPTPLFKIIARQMLAIDPKARSSMWDDIKLGRKTEIDEFQGQIIDLGKKHAIATPECQRVYDEIKVLES